MTSWRHLPAPARAIAQAITDAVEAVRARDEAAFASVVPTLAAVDGSGLVLGSVVRLLLEEHHPDGLDGDDIREVLDDTLAEAGQWQSDVEPHTLLVLLAGALGVHDEDEQAPQHSPQALARHAALLLGYLLTGAAHPLSAYLSAAFTEIERTEQYDG